MKQLNFRRVFPLCIILINILYSCDKNIDDEGDNSSKEGSVVTVHVCNATTKTGHYIYRVKIEDNFTDKCLLDESVNLKNGIDTDGKTAGTYKKFKITADPKYRINNWKVTIYAKGGKYGSQSDSRMYQPYSSFENTIFCYWQGTYISQTY
jgi:hypothetical protein